MKYELGKWDDVVAKIEFISSSAKITLKDFKQGEIEVIYTLNSHEITDLYSLSQNRMDK